MQRRNSFEDFEEMFDASSKSSENKNKGPKDNETPAGAVNPDKAPETLDFDGRMARRNPEVQIPAMGSEMFEEVGPTYEEFSEEERYRIREERALKRSAQRRRNRHFGGKLLACLQLIISAVFMALLLVLDVLPMKYFLLLSVILALCALGCFFLQRGRVMHWVGKIISIVLILTLAVGSVYVEQTRQVLNRVTKTRTTQTDKIVVAVLTEDPAETMEDAVDYRFGIMSALDRSIVDRAITQMNGELKTELDTKEYDTYSTLVKELYGGKVDGMIYNQALNELIEENNPGFLEKIRVIEICDIKTEVYMEDIPDLPITKQPFIVYLSGMDVYGELEQTSRSDVNIMACVNPTTKQVLLVSVPRDAYVEIPGITMGEKDKLTHAGMYGIQYSIAAMEDIFDVDIAYYAQVNFTAIITMVDALGGIDVDSDYAFSTYYKQYDEATGEWSYYEYVKGENHLDGKHALAFARERKNAVGGDYQRGRNQEKVIEALMNKLKSPAILTGYTELLESLEGTMDTNLSSRQIASLVKMQLNDGADWNIVSASVYGEPSDEYCASYSGSALSVEILDEASLEAVGEVIADLMAGRTISEPRKTDLQEIYEAVETEEADFYMNNHADDDEYDDFYWENGGYEYGDDYSDLYDDDADSGYY